MKRLSHLRSIRPKSEALPVIDCTAFSAAYPLGSCFFYDVSASCKKLQHAYNHHIAVSIRNLSTIKPYPSLEYTASSYQRPPM